MQRDFKTIIKQTPQLITGLARQWHTATGGTLQLLAVDGNVLWDAEGNVGQVPPAVRPTAAGLEVNSDAPTMLMPFYIQRERMGYLFASSLDPNCSPMLQWLAERLGADLESEISLQSMTDELIAAWNQLDLMYRINQTMAEKANLSDALNSVLQEVIGVVKIDTAFVLLSHDERVECVTAGLALPPELQCPQSFLEQLIQTERLLVINDAKTIRKMWCDAPPSLHNFAGTHIATSSNTTATLGLINKQTQFTAGDMKLMTAIAEQLGSIIDNFKMQQELIHQERVGRELEIAAEIQQSLLPHTVPNFVGLSIDVNSMPAFEVGGDFYDFVQLDDEHLTVAVGDVAGKGIPAAMFTSMVRTMMRVEAFHSQEPHVVIRRVNEILQQDLSQAELFVTAFMATIDTKKNVLAYANAGHTPGIIYHAQSKTSRLLKATTLPIGIEHEEFRPTQYVHLAPGDTLVLYSDGITEAKNPRDGRFGLQRVQQLVHQHADKSPTILKQIILNHLTDFQETEPATDDVTLVVIKVTEQPVVQPKSQQEWQVVQEIPFEYQADTAYLNDISTQVTTACRTLAHLPSDAVGADFVYLVELAVSEICTNMIEHSYAGQSGAISGKITLATTGVQVDIFDQGESFNPNAVPPPMSDPMDPAEGGYGLHIVRQIMDVAEYQPNTSQGNHWRLVKYLPA